MPFTHTLSQAPATFLDRPTTPPPFTPCHASSLACADHDYQAFLQALELGPSPVPTAQAQLEAQEAARSGEGSGPVVTTLMAFLQKKYETTPFTGRRGSRAARRREGAKLTSLLEEVSQRAGLVMPETSAGHYTCGIQAGGL